MKTYGLHLESGPMRKKTMVHVPALPGCIAQGPTTEAALEAAPEGIRRFLRFLARPGERVDPDADFRTKVVEHITKGVFLGNGIVFVATDVAPLSKRDIDSAMQRLSWIHDDLKTLVGGLSAKKLDTAPSTGRPVRRILTHMAGAEGAYLRGLSGVSRMQREMEQGQLDPLDALDRLLEMERARLDGMADDERSAVVQRGQSQWTVRHALRRMLEHGWEHYCEVATRLGAAL